MKRSIDLILSLFLLLLLAIPMLGISIFVKIFSKGPVLYWSSRVGKDGNIFKMPKFRTMKVNAPMVATHLLHDPKEYLSPFGSFLRKYSFDEFPQLFSIIRGDMSFVGPRPALFNQVDLINLRNERGINSLVPGLTGWAQINGRDNLSINEKVAFDAEYMKKKSFLFDLHILWKTFVRVLKSEGVSH